ncbi:hypothetical protein ACUOFU_14525 [Microbacterium arabinogalactanolyticum]|uniref:hypothetical protein n=1 Tax=Microbacterium arabinogalactanolyticum TaxID=69365 RepID=UPI004043CDD3
MTSWRSAPASRGKRPAIAPPSHDGGGAPPWNVRSRVVYVRHQAVQQHHEPKSVDEQFGYT